MPTPTYRILACMIPVQAILLLAFTWHSTQPPASDTAPLVDHIVISKSHHTLTLFTRGTATHTYLVALGRVSGAKQFAGDHKTPLGRYTVDAKNAHSRFHLALHLSYPNPNDRVYAAAQHRPPGGDVEIHGLLPALAFVGALHRTLDWTDGCIALTNPEIDQVFRLTPTGTPVDITP